MKTICIIGASTSWTPGLVVDLLHVFDERLEIRLIDIDPAAAELCREWGETANKAMGRNDVYTATTDRRAALHGADAVLITISTGGLDAMEHDIKIPEEYGIYATVGDTAGPGGWSRSIRNIPVFEQFARDFDEICPSAFISNYTNPMSSLTATLQKGCRNPLTGLCHSYFEIKDVIQEAFSLKDWGPISISLAGMNHCTWVVDFTIGREKGYPLLRKKLNGASLRTLFQGEIKDELGYCSGHALCCDLYDAYGYLPYPADRHTSEFFSFVLTGNQERYFADYDGQRMETVRPYGVRRTSVESRRESMPKREARIRSMIAGETALPAPSRETGAHMIHAYLTNRPFTDAVNLLNVGQVPQLPLGACVETMGVVDGFGARPLLVTDLPEPLAEVMRPQAVCQKWITEGTITRNKDLLLQALYRDPQCAHLRPVQIREMAQKLFEANRSFITFP